MAGPQPDPELLSMAQALGIAARGVVEGLRVGEHRSPFRGYSAEFAQHREYVPGDDTRHIDWKAYGRSQRYTVKQYEQETNFVTHILVDASGSMGYGEGPSNKLNCARLTALTLAHVVIRQRDSAAISLFADGWRGRWPATDQPGSLAQLVQSLASVEAAGPTALAAALTDLAVKEQRRGLVFVITDALDDADELLQGLRHLRFRGHEVALLHVLHGDEIHFPFDGRVRFVGTEGPGVLRAQARHLRARYLRALADHRDKVVRGCNASRVDYVLVDTGRPLAATLIEYLGHRRRVRRPR